MTLHPLESSGRGAAAARWIVAASLVLAVYAGAGWWIATHPVNASPRPETVQGIPIDLEPIAVPQNAPQPNATMASGATDTP